MKIVALFSRVSSAFPGTSSSQSMDCERCAGTMCSCPLASCIVVGCSLLVGGVVVVHSDV